MPIVNEEIHGGGMKIGKVIASKYNCGIALIDITKLDKIGANAEFKMDDYRVILWQPMWLDMVHSRKAKYDEDDEKME
jgi:hypothetical protein